MAAVVEADFTAEAVEAAVTAKTHSLFPLSCLSSRRDLLLHLQ